MLDIFQFDFMIRAFIAGIAIAIVAPLIGIFLVVRRYSLMADTLSHVALLGVSAGVLLHIYPLVTAIVFTGVAATGIEKLRANNKLPSDALLALFLTGSLALAVVLMNIARGFNINFLSFLFGSISTVTPADLVLIVPLCAIALLIVLALFKELFLISLDEEIATANGIKTKALNFMVVTLAAVIIVLSLKIVGTLLIGALLVVPVLTAMQWNRSFTQTAFLAVLFSLLSVIGGIFLSYYLGLSSGGTIVILALILFMVSMVFGEKSHVS